MRSVADALRDEDRQALRRLSAEERLRLALRLGDRDLESFCAHHGLDRASGMRHLRAQRQKGRTPSACMTETGTET